MQRIIVLIRQHYFPLIISLFIFYSLILIYRSSFVIEGVRYFSLFDDAMISMRYAYNLVHGYGMVWNPGAAPVEGFTTPLWALFMAAVHLLPVGIEITSLFVQLGDALTLVVTLYFVKKLCELLDKKSVFLSITSLLFTALYFPLNHWATILGMEVGPLTLLTVWCSYLTLRILKTGRPSLLLFMLLGVGTGFRMDFVIPAVIMTGFLILFNAKNRNYYLLVGIPIIFTFLAVQVLVRMLYYHDIFPNTYYLKMTGYPPLRRITRGIYVGLVSMNWIAVSIPFIYAFLRKDRQIVLLLALFVGQILYSMYVGGDAWEYFGGANRYVVIAMPTLFIAMFYTALRVRDLVKRSYPRLLFRYRVTEYGVLVLLFLVFNGVNHAAFPQMMLIKPSTHVGENSFQVRMAKSLQEVTKKDATIGIVWAGITPYFTRRTFIDNLGKTEKIIAREPARLNDENLSAFQKYTSFWPGHTKWDYEYLVTTYKPDIFAMVYPQSETKYLKKDYIRYFSPEGIEYYVRRGTDQVDTHTFRKVEDRKK